MQLEETIAKEMAGIIKEQINEGMVSTATKIDALRRVLDARLNEIEVQRAQINDAPNEVIDEIAKAIALLAEAPELQDKHANPVVVNFSSAVGNKKTKTITTRRDEAGNLVARVIED